MGGFDGEVETTQGSAYIPKGKCILEFGTNKDFKTKAEGDYTTRTEKDYEGLNKAEATFLFMIPRCWVTRKTGTERKNGMVGAYLNRSPVFVLFHITALSYRVFLRNSMLYVLI